MKVLLANNYYCMRGVAERVMFNDLEELRARRRRCTVFGHGPGEFVQRPLRRVRRERQCTRNRHDGRLRAAREAIHCGRTADAFARVLDKESPDIVHFHNIYGRLTTSILPLTRKRGIPSVMTVHDYKVACPAHLMLRNGKPCMACLDGRYIRCALHRCHKGNLAASTVCTIETWHARRSGSYDAVSAFLCPSRFIADILEQSGIDESRIIYHPNCVDPDSYEPAYEGSYALFTGQLSHEKGIGTLLEAVKGTGIPLKIAGTGPLLQSLENQVANSGLKNISFEGHCTGEPLAALYRKAALVVVPSQWFENAPMVILEAFAYGKPVVAARIGGIPEMVDEGRTGRLFMPGNVMELRHALSSLWNRPDELRRMGFTARAAVETRFSEKRRVTALITIYERLRTEPRNAVSRPAVHTSGLNVVTA
ncbi:MAG TPA: glycosyltransferase [Bryobacteraceae bacterium]|nr:glycosyltransferase [Bryobacteraceae bacterium]